jgi:hypothetical protein
MSDIDAVNALNERLAGKPDIQYTRDVVFDVGFSKFTIPEAYAAKAQASDARIEVIKEAKVFEEEATSLPTKILINRQRYIWCSDGEYSQTINLSVTGTKGYTIKKTSGIKNVKGNSVTLSVNYNPGPVGGVAGGVTANYTNSIEVTSSEEITENSQVVETISESINFKLTKRETGYIQLIAYQYNARIPFRCRAVIDGALVSNTSGFSKVSQILSVEERTLEISGYIEISGVTNGLKEIKADPSPQCTIESDKIRFLPATNAKLEFSDASFEMMNSVEDWDKQASLFIRNLNKLDGSTIGPPSDGDHYEILSSYEVLKASVQCGFNDLSIPNPGKYRIETRRYSTYVDGKVVSTRVEDVDVFLECYPV